MKGKDSRNIISNITPGGIRPNRNNIKKVPTNYSNGQGRTKITNNRSNLKERIKTIDYNDSKLKSLVNRSNTVQRRRIIHVHNNYSGNEGGPKPYSNFGPSNNTRSNITIERSGSLGINKENITQASISHSSKIKNSSKKVFGPINEYEDDNILTLNSHSYGGKNTIEGIVKNKDYNLTINSFKNKISNTEISKRSKFNKVARKELQSKSNKRVTRENFEKVYLHPPTKLFKNGHSQVKLRKNINNNDSQGALVKKINFRDKTVSPFMPKVNGVIAVNNRHKTTLKARHPQKFNNSMKNEVSSINTIKDPSRLNFAQMKHGVRFWVLLI